MSVPPIVYIWHDVTPQDVGKRAMFPFRRYGRLADQSHILGHAYHLTEQEERSRASHNQYFAAVHSAWMNLPERLQLAFPTENHLRKYALIEAGFCTAKRVLKGARVAIDKYAVIDTDDHGGCTVYEALSQKTRGPDAMAPADFQKSKQVVLEILADMVGVTPDELLASKAA